MGLFVALKLSEPVLDRLSKTTRELKTHAVSGRFSHRENLHLTLAFIGETTNVSGAKQALSQISAPEFEMTIAGGGRFKRDGGDIVWAGVEKNRSLEQLAAQVQALLRKKGFVLQERPFAAHLTLGREVILEPDFDLRAFFAGQDHCTMQVERVSLMKSERISGKLVYTEIAFVGLNNNSYTK